MASYLVLASFTDQGARTIKDTVKRSDAVRELAGKFGVNMKSIYWTLGQYDVVTVCEANDEASFTAFGMALATQGNVRTQTLRAFTRDEMAAVLSKLP